MPPPAPPAPQEPRRGNHHWENSDDDEHMTEISMIFEGSMSFTSKTQGKKLQREINLAQRIEPGRRMRWSDVDISFRPEDHPITELSERNLPFIVKIPIGRHRVAKTMIDSGASLNLLMRRTFIEMGLSLADLTPVQDTFHRIIPVQSSTPIGRIDLKVSCGSGENKRRETLTFEVASFDIGYNCILGRPFLLKFMAIIHTAYATIKMPGPKDVITLKSGQRDAVACENATLTHAGKFGNKEAQDLAVKMAVVFLLHLLCYQLRVSSNKESSNAQIFSQSKSSDQPLILCNIIGSRKLKLNCILQNITFGWYKYNTSSCSFQGVRSVKIHYPMIG
jgi:hypothetical protein